MKGFSKRVEETGPKSVEAKKEIQVGAAAITTHDAPRARSQPSRRFYWDGVLIPARAPMQRRRRRSAKRAKGHAASSLALDVQRHDPPADGRRATGRQTGGQRPRPRPAGGAARGDRPGLPGKHASIHAPTHPSLHPSIPPYYTYNTIHATLHIRPHVHISRCRPMVYRCLLGCCAPGRVRVRAPVCLCAPM